MTNKESQNIEYKKSWHDNNLKTICAFANTAGGILFVGIDDNGKSVELKNISKLLEDIPNKINSILGIIPDIKVVKKKNNSVIKISIKKYIAPISYHGKFYIRSGSITTELKGFQLSEFLLSRLGNTWDIIIEPSATIKDIDIKTVRHFQKLTQKRFPYITKEKDIKIILKKLNLLQKEKIKRAALLLFAKNPKKYFTSAFVQIGRFLSDSDVISTDIVEGNLFDQIEKTIEILKIKYLENRFYYEGIYRKEDTIYPEAALREAVINAVVHRDYMGPHTQIKVYDDRLWIWNSGYLPQGISCDNLKKPHSSYPRNKLIADIFFKAGFIESWGRGTIKILEICKNSGIAEPAFKEEFSGFSVLFNSIKVGDKDGDKKSTPKKYTKKVHQNNLPKRYTKTSDKIIEFIKNDPEIKIRKIAEILDITERAVKKQIKKLKEEYKIIREGKQLKVLWKNKKSTPKMYTKKVHQKSSPKKFTETYEKIIVLIKNNPEITINKMSETLNITSRAVKKQIRKLKEQEIIIRKGSSRKGKWYING